MVWVGELSKWGELNQWGKVKSVGGKNNSVGVVNRKDPKLGSNRA